MGLCLIQKQEISRPKAQQKSAVIESLILA